MLRVRLLRIWEDLREGLWFVPTLMALAALLAALGLVRLDPVLDAWQLAGGGLFSIDDPAGARSVLATIASSEITVAGVVFSITILVLNMASAQFGPRLIPNFMREGSTQIVLGTFVGSFIYCLAVLAMIRSGGNGDAPFIPQAAVGGGLLLGIASFGVLIFFIHRVAVFIQAPRIIDDVARRLDVSIANAFPDRRPYAPPRLSPARAGTPIFAGERLAATGAGYVQAIDLGALIHAAREADGRARLLVRPGDYASRGEAVACVAGGLAGSERGARQIREAIVLGPQRTQTQDPAYGVYQLVEIALRALSPSINDPFTAISCIDRLGNALGGLADRDEPPRLLEDQDGTPRLEVRPYTHRLIVDAAFDQLRRAGSGHLVVTARLLGVIRMLLERGGSAGFRQALLDQADAVHEAAADWQLAERDRRELEACYETIDAVRGVPAAEP